MQYFNVLELTYISTEVVGCLMYTSDIMKILYILYSSQETQCFTNVDNYNSWFGHIQHYMGIAPRLQVYIHTY